MKTTNQHVNYLYVRPKINNLDVRSKGTHQYLHSIVTFIIVENSENQYLNKDMFIRNESSFLFNISYHSVFLNLRTILFEIHFST